VDRVLLHEGYVRNTMVNDIALVRLSRDVEFCPTIRPIGLPAPGKEPPLKLLSTGWGETGNGIEADDLQEAVFDYVRNEACRIKWPWFRFIIFESSLCMYMQSPGSSCYKDTGNPVINER